EYRGEFGPINTNVPGVQIWEHFPQQARMWDKLACIRSIVAVEEHSDSETMTGYSENTNRTAHHPSVGAVLSRVRGSNGTGTPPFVSLRGLSIGCEPGFLGVAHRAFPPDGPGLGNLSLPGQVDTQRSNERRGLLEQLDTLRREVDASGTMRGMDVFTTRAYDMVGSGAVRRALDLT